MSSASTLGEREDGIPRLSGVTATVLTATVAAAAAQAATTTYILVLAATAIVIPALIWVVGRTRPADALPLGFALALVAVTAAFSAWTDDASRQVNGSNGLGVLVGGALS